MTYKAIRNFTEPENNFIAECGKKKIDYKKLQQMIDNGLDVNAYEENDFPNEGVCREYLIEQCILEIGTTHDLNDYINFLDFMEKNKLNFSMCANNLVSILHFTYNNIIDITKYLLSKVRPDDLKEENLEGMGIEESYLNCCMQDHKMANKLSISYEMIEKFINKKQDYKKYFEYTNAIGKTINDVNLYCDNVKIDNSKKFIVDNIDMFFECNGERLCVLNKYIFVNNNEIYTEYDKYEHKNEKIKTEGFVQNIKEYISGEIIENIILRNQEISISPRSYYSATIIIIELSNNKQIKFGCDETGTLMKITIK